MKKRVFAFITICLLTSSAASAEQKSIQAANQLFYQANAHYEKGEYAKAVESYIKILDMNLEGGNVYYNIGNGFFKLGKIGYAILCYEKAKRLIPQDSDLKSNLDYAKSLVEDSVYQPTILSSAVRIIEKPFGSFDLNTMAILAAAFYVVVTALAVVFITRPPLMGRRALSIATLFSVIFLWMLAAFILRYYDEEILKHGIVVQKDVEGKYEPIDKSTTYYTLHEGAGVGILKTRNGWRQIKRTDGKMGWVKKETVEEI